MRYFVDAEYDFDAASWRITPISIGIVAADGRELYAITTAFSRESCSPFVREHVIPVLLPGYQCSIDEIAERLVVFVGDDVPEFWGDYAAFDYVVLSIIMGGFDHWPSHWPMHINDLQQDAVPSVESKVPHHALHDARAVRDAYDWAFADHSVEVAGVKA